MEGPGTSGLAERREEQVAEDEFFKRIAETQEPVGAVLREGPVGTAARRAVQRPNGEAAEPRERRRNGHAESRRRRTLERSSRSGRRKGLQVLIPLVAIGAVAGGVVTAVSAIRGSTQRDERCLPNRARAAGPPAGAGGCEASRCSTLAAESKAARSKEALGGGSGCRRLGRQ